MFGLTLVREQDLQFYRSTIKELKQDLIAEKMRTDREKIRSDRIVDNLMTALNQLPVSDEAIGRMREQTEKGNGLLSSLTELLPEEIGKPEDWRDPDDHADTKTSETEADSIEE